MNLPNILTVGRFVLALGFIFMMNQEGWCAIVVALFLFSLAALTDYFDGHFARKHQLISDFGKLMDPLADKFLILAAFFIFVRMGIFPIWAFVVIASREIIVTVFRLWAARTGKVLGAERLGKWKTALQITTIIVILLFLIGQRTGQISPFLLNGGSTLIYGLILGSVVLTLSSGLTLLRGLYRGLSL